MPSYQFLAVARIQFRQRDIVYFGKQDIGGFSFLHDREPELRCKNVQQDVQLFPVPEPARATLENIIFPDTGGHSPRHSSMSQSSSSRASCSCSSDSSGNANNFYIHLCTTNLLRQQTSWYRQRFSLHPDWNTAITQQFSQCFLFFWNMPWNWLKGPEGDKSCSRTL